MGVGYTRSCYSLNWGRLLTWLLFLGWGLAARCFCSSDVVGCLWGYCSLDMGRLITRLLLLGWGWAARAAAALRTGVSCTRGCSSSDGDGPFTWLLLLKQVQAVCGSASWTRACCAGLPLLGHGRSACVAAARMGRGCSQNCCSSDGGGLLTQLLLLELGRLLVWLLLLE
uniref:Secreted protein n=1 Tax=Myotis myotis TaxID=51298 RepID=A0A7J7RMK9_MYOMY|nr:hypothetical protein mMyoMyo1_010251 [Myotis myotis]